MSFVHTARALPAIGRPGARNAVALRTNMAPLALATLLSFTANSAFAQSVPAKVAAAEVADAATSTADASAQATLKATTVTSSALRETPQNLKQPVQSGALGSRSQLDTPFSTTVVSQEQLEQRQPAKLGEVFSTDASVTDGSNAFDAWAGYVYVRGMPIDWQYGFKLDGLPVMTYGVTMPYEQFDRVELLKGLSGFMYGFVAPGGVVNYVTKKPTDERIASVDLGFHSDGIWREHVDLGGRAGPNDMFGARLNYTHEEGRTYTDGNLNRDTVSVALDARITRDLTWNFGAMYQDRRATGTSPSLSTFSFSGNQLPGPINVSNANLQTQATHLNTITQFYTTGLQYQIDPDWKVSANYAFNKSTRDRNEATLYLLNGAGNFSGQNDLGDENNTFRAWQLTAEGKVRTGPFAHQLTFGIASQYQTNDYAYIYSPTYTGNLYQGTSYQYYGDGTTLKAQRSSAIEQRSVFASDTVQITERLSVLGGVRFTNYNQTNAQGISTYSTNGVFTPTLAVMYKVAPNTTAYASYVEALEAGEVVGATYANAGAVLNPFKSRQYELGVKTEQDTWSTTAALFRIERGAVYTNSANARVADGQSIYQGIELAGSVKLGPQWTLGASAMALDSWYARTNGFDGNRVGGAPRFVLSGNLEYKVPYVPGLSVGGDIRYNGRTSLNPQNSLTVSGYTLINLGATYRTRVAGKDVTLRAAVSNLTNRKYWQYQYDNYIKAADPRMVSLNAKIDF
ncbi:TonB-dependent siderophore receptor [Pandoraea apista]|uniref:TonB-dependent receptor n=3 Tax=Pandoraea apista TaxID=93218 RepID=A0ABX9ZKL4_9BURK|nr:TonB-dependent receptor [Pandoraea apista]PTD98870.1 TonB-dependent siderophore receptor [Pandoraea apista]RSK77193.1 TonB-dependent receptor [Pandoraea apista]RUN89047.1 TonB-dependent receptor [Pandoraea apista]